jgi:4-hydroxy-tetrahydrodipicolinate synthase
MSVIANAFPQQFTTMIHHALSGDFKSASKELGKFLTIDPFLYEEGNPVGVKKLLENQGLFGAQVRMPLASASLELGKKLAQISSQEALNK